MSDMQFISKQAEPKLILPTVDKIKNIVEQGLASLQLVPFGEKIKSTSSEVPHSDLSDIDSLVLKDGTKLYGAVPDKADPARVHFYKRDIGGDLQIDSVAELRDQNGKVFEAGKIDAEAIRFFKDKDGKQKAVIASEGESVGYDKSKTDSSVPAEERIRNPQIFICDVEIKDNKVTALQVDKVIKYPEHYLNQVRIDDADKTKTIDTHGTRNNGSFESVAITKDNKLVLITEFPLVQDGPNASTKEGGQCRMLIIDLNNESNIKEHVYTIDKIERSWQNTEKDPEKLKKYNEAKIANEENGVVSIYPHPDKPNTFLVMERSFLRTTEEVEVEKEGIKTKEKRNVFVENSIRIYEATIDADSTDVTGADSIKDREIRPVKKELFLDFKDLKGVFADYNARTGSNIRADNYEGMTLNYNAEKKAWELICVSDNNSNKHQGATQILRLLFPAE